MKASQLPPTFVLLMTLLLPAVLAPAQKLKKPLPKIKPTISLSELSAREVARRALPSVVLIVCENDKVASQGSGFFISPGILVTNYHVIEGNTRGVTQIALGPKKQKVNLRIARVIGYDEVSDLALLKVPTAEKLAIPSLELVADDSNTEVGSPVFALGNPEGLSGTISTGIVSANMRSSEKKARLQITAPISHGSSGGPIVDSHGKVVGVAVGSLTEGQNLNFAVPAFLVRNLIRETIEKDRKDPLSSIDDVLNNDELPPENWLWRKSNPSNFDRPSQPKLESIIGGRRPGESADVASLRKLNGVFLAIEYLSPAAKEIISETQLQTDLELRLRRNSIRVLNEDEWIKSPGSPYLYLNISVLKQASGVYTYRVSLELRQDVVLSRDSTFSIQAPTWADNTTGYAGSQVATGAVRDAIGEIVDKFCNDFLKANSN